MKSCCVRIFVLFFATHGVGVALGNRPRHSCSPTVPIESTEARVTCAIEALQQHNFNKAYQLMAPLYRRIYENSPQNSAYQDAENKLKIFVQERLQRPSEELISTYGVRAVYAALAFEDNYDPTTGAFITVKNIRTLENLRRKAVLTPSLVATVHQVMQGE